MQPILDYAYPGAISRWRAGRGYFALILVNALAGMAAVIECFVFGSGKIPLPADDAYLSPWCIVIGGFLLMGQAFFGMLPAWFYLSRYGEWMNKWLGWLLFVFSVAPILPAVIGVAIAFVLAVLRKP